jgi:hypothetical protein
MGCHGKKEAKIVFFLKKQKFDVYIVRHDKKGMICSLVITVRETQRIIFTQNIIRWPSAKINENSIL